MLYITVVRRDLNASVSEPQRSAQGVVIEVSGTVKLVLLILAAIIGVYIVIKLLAGLVATVLSLIIPLALVLGIGYVIYLAIDRKALGGSRRYLP